MKRRYIFKASRYLSRLKNEEGIMPKIIMIRYKTSVVVYSIIIECQQSNIIINLLLSLRFAISATITLKKTEFQTTEYLY
jgi:hypothetical protein